MGAAAEKAGIPAVSIVAPEFVNLCKTAVQGEGITSLAFANFPQQMMSGGIEDMGDACEKVTGDIVYALTRWKPEENEAGGEKWIEFEGKSFQEAVDEMNNVFLIRRWADGLPLVPPTEERVAWMLSGTCLPPRQVLSAKVYPRRRPITVENVAIHAAMAGARPEYMPVILGTVKLLDTDTPDGNKLVHFLQESVGMFAPVLIVNGSIGKEINLNSSFGVMGPGWQADATIGRAISLLLITAGGYSGPPDGTPREHSLPARYTCCFAENEKENPWQPLHVELGHGAHSSTVTLMVSRGTQTVMVHPPADYIARSIAWAVKGLTGKSYAMSYEQLIVLSPAHAHVLAKAGWSKEKIRSFVYENSRLSVAEAEDMGMTIGWGEWRDRLGADKNVMYPKANVTDRSMLVPMIENPDYLTVVVAGGPGGDNSTLIPCIARKLTEEIDQYKPAHWQDLIGTARRQLRY